MADNNNPIRYKDLVSPDDSIEKLIQQLDELSDTYRNALKNIKAEAIRLNEVLKSVSGATEAGRNTTRKAATDADKLARAHRDLAFAESDNAVKLAELKNAQREANEINKLTVKLNQSAEGSYNKLSAQYSLNKIYLNNMTVAEREATEEGKELVAQTKAIYDEMNRLQKVTGKSQLNVGNYPEVAQVFGNYGDKVKEYLGLNNEFGNSLITMAQNGEGAKGMFTAIGDGAKALGRTLLTLLANPVFLAIAGIAGVGVAFKFWFDYNQGLIEATRLTQQFTGKTGDDLKFMRNEVQALADTYGKDFKEVLQASNAVALQFGISQEEALKTVKDGFLAGADANGEYLQTLKEYPTFFKEAGLSAREFVAITTQANKSGIYSDKAVDTIKEGNLRIREMTKATADALTGIGLNYKELQTNLQNGSMTTFDVMQMVSEKLNELPESSAAVGTAIADIFGGPGEDAGLQYLKTLKDIDTNLDTVKDNAGELAKIQEEQLKSQVELQNVISGLFDMTGGTFEMMTAKAKIFVNDAMVKIIKSIVDVINYFIRLYNDSVAFRVVVAALIANFQLMWDTVKALFSYMIENIKIIGDALHGAFTLNWDEVKGAYARWGQNLKTLVQTSLKNTHSAIKSGVNNINKNVEEIKIPVAVEPVGETPAAKPKGGGKPTKIADYTKPDKTKDNSKELEQIRKKNLDLLRKYQDAELELETNEFEKRRKKTLYNYERQREDLKYQLENEKDLTKEGRKAITDLIAVSKKQETAELTKIQNDQDVFLLDKQKQAIQLRLEATRKGSEQEYKLKLELIEKERQLELLQNRTRTPENQQSETEINQKYNVKVSGTNDEFLKLQMQRFDILQEMEQSEFDLMRNSEARKTKFRLEAEKARLLKILELNKQMGNKLSDEEIKIIQNTIQKIDNEMSQADKGKGKDIYDLLGINLDDDAKQAINDSVSFAIGQIGNVLAAKVQAAEKAIEANQREVDASQSRLDAELLARANGYANDVAFAQKELDNDRKNLEKAQKDKEKAVKQQQALDTISQTSSLVTATANIWAALSGIKIVGPILALAAIGTMWASFGAAKIKAAQITKKRNAETYGDGTLQYLAGGSHQSGNDIDLGSKPDGTKRRAEGGELMAIFNKRSSRKFRSILPGLVRSINDGSFVSKYMNSFKGSEGINLTIPGETQDMSQLKKDVAEIRDQGKRRYYSDGSGTTEVYKNLKRRITR